MVSRCFEALDWNDKADGCAPSGIRLNATTSADISQALGHVAQAIATCGRSFSIADVHIETGSIVRNGDFQGRYIAMNRNFGLGASGMLEDIRKSFMGCQEKVMARL